MKKIVHEKYVNLPDLDPLQKLQYFPEPIAKLSADLTVQSFLNQFKNAKTRRNFPEVKIDFKIERLS